MDGRQGDQTSRAREGSRARTVRAIDRRLPPRRHWPAVPDSRLPMADAANDTFDGVPRHGSWRRP